MIHAARDDLTPDLHQKILLALSLQALHDQVHSIALGDRGQVDEDLWMRLRKTALSELELVLSNPRRQRLENRRLRHNSALVWPKAECVYERTDCHVEGAA